MTNTKTKTSPAKAVAAVVIAVILAFTLVCLLTGNINPVCRVTAMLMPVWLAAELRLCARCCNGAPADFAVFFPFLFLICEKRGRRCVRVFHRPDA